MSKIAVVYWSGTGNTEEMAKSIAEGAEQAGAEATLIECEDFNSAMMDEYSAIAFGCPSMGEEVLEKKRFRPMFESCKEKLSGKKIGLFGSCRSGSGIWMRNWEADCKGCGACLAHDCITCRFSPDCETAQKCMNMGKALA